MTVAISNARRGSDRCMEMIDWKECEKIVKSRGYYDFDKIDLRFLVKVAKVRREIESTNIRVHVSSKIG